MSEKISIIGDFGGTNARLALSTPDGMGEVSEYSCENFKDPGSVITQFMEEQDLDIVHEGVFAVAGDASDPQEIVFTNGPWKQKPLNFEVNKIESTTTINDFTAMGYSVALLKSEDTETITSGNLPFFPSTFLSDPDTYKNNSSRRLISNSLHRFVTIGPGTGLGVSSGLVTESGQFAVLGGEGGHTDFAPDTPEELELKRYLDNRHTVATTKETIASGTGLVTTYNAVCRIRGIDSEILHGGELKSKLTHDNVRDVRNAAEWTLELFAETLGKCAAETVLTMGARTVFITGGVIPKLGENFLKPVFTRAFHKNDLGRNNTVTDTPVVLVTHKQPGLLGAHAYIRLGNT